MLSTLRIVLVETSHPGNIGAAARAMKNMDLADLRLVKPREFPHLDAYARASGAEDVLNAARVHDSLDEAVADCGLVVGASARSRQLALPVSGPRECAAELVAAAHDNQVALVFGSERTGLTNAELGRCHRLVTIPTSEVYSSLNVAMAVQVLAYEVFIAAHEDASKRIEHESPLATLDEMAQFYAHLEQALTGTDFRDHSSSGQLMARVRCLFNRACPDQNEVRILRGILGALERGKRFTED